MIVPCPFCHKANAIVIANIATYHVACQNIRCKAEGPIRKREIGAIKAWNQRPSPITILQLEKAELEGVS